MTCDPFAGLSRQWKDIPDWQKGSKVSLSSDDGSVYRDSSDEAGHTDDDGGVVDDSDTDAGDGYDVEAAGLDVEKTPRAKAKALKRADYEKALVSSIETAKLSGPTTLKRRPRASSISSPTSSGSGSSGRSSLRAQSGLGPAAKNFSNWTANQSQPVAFNNSASNDHTAVTSSSSSSAPGPSLQTSFTRNKLNRTRAGGLDRATSAPSGLFSSPPTSTQSKAKGADKKANAIEESDSDSGHATQCVDKVIDAAFAAVSGNVELANCGLYNLPSNIGSMRHMVSHDPRSGMSYSTPIHLTLSNNYLTAQGLPPALFEIHNLSSLFLRANQLDELPTAIGDLKKLKHLSVAVNKLKYLPAEILQLNLEELTASPNRFIPYSSVVAAKPKVEGETSSISTSRKCSIRKQNFRVPSLVELCTRQLLAEVPEPTLKRKSFSPSISNVQTKRYFHQCKEEAISPRTDAAPVPGHLLKPFLPLLQPLPHHLRYLLKEQNAFNQHSNFIQSCSVCKTPCSQFAEERLEWRYEIAGQKVADQNDPEQWIPVRWRGCSANCLDFLDE